jgi:hypothetical protein
VSGGFAQLQAQIPEHVGTCQGTATTSRPELGEATQATSNGRLIYLTVDGVVSFTDGSHTWVLDPNGEVQVRNVDERLAFEFNGDGFPLVGQPAPQINGVCPTTPLSVLTVENFYASLVNQIGGQCVSTTMILSDPDADPPEFQPTAAGRPLIPEHSAGHRRRTGYDDFSDKSWPQWPPSRRWSKLATSSAAGRCQSPRLVQRWLRRPDPGGDPRVSTNNWILAPSHTSTPSQPPLTRSSRLTTT